MHSLYKNQVFSFLENLTFGIHICFFYQRKEGLIDILIPYFKEGLKNNEYCIWINPEPLKTNHVAIKLKDSLNKLSDYKKKIQFEVVPFKDWFFNGNKFDFHYAFNKWSEKVNTVLDLGFKGLRLVNNISLLNINYWELFRQYEQSVNDAIALYKSIILCTFPLRDFNLFEILDSIDDHQHSIINYSNSWRIIKSSSEFNFKEKLTINEDSYKSVNNIFQSPSSTRKKIEKQIKEYKYFLSNLFSSIQDGICIIDTHLNITFANPKMDEWYPEETPLQGKKCYEVFYGRSMPCEDCKCKSVLKSGEMCCILNYEKKFEGKIIRYFNVYSYPFYDLETHEINGIIKYFRDETKFATAKQKLRDSEEKYRRIFDNSPLGIGISSIDGTVIAINKKMEEITGYNIKELNDLGMENLYVDPSKRNGIVEKVKNQGFIRDYEVKKKRKDGTSYLALLNIDLIDNEGDSLLHTTIRDITYQKLGEKKLKESENKFRSFVESTPVATFLYQNYECIYANPAAINLTEYSLDELYTLKFWDFVHPDYRKTVIDIGKALERKEPFTLVNKIKITTKNGSEKWINGNMVLIEYEGKRAALISAIDITDQKVAEQKLKESEFKYRTLFEETLTPIFITNIKGMYVDANKAALEFVECTIDELRKKNVFDFSPPQVLEKQKQEHGPFYGKRTLETEYYINGKIKTLLLNVVPFEIEEKKLLFGIGPDLTERKIIEAKLKDSEKKYRHLANELEMILDHIPGIVVYKDTENNMIRVNKFLADAHNLTKEQIEGKNAFSFYPRDQAEAYWRDDLEVIKTGLPKLNIVEPWEPEAGKRWVNTSKIPYIDEKGKVKGIIAIAQDITEQRKAEEKLKESEEKFRTIVEQSLLGLSIVQDGFVKFINQAFSNIVEYSVEEMHRWTSKDTLKVIYEEDLPMVHEILKKREKGDFKSIIQYQCRINTKSAKLKWVEVISKPILYHGRKATIISLIDITEKKKAEEKLKEINRLKSEFLSRTSHEIKTPLVSIKGYLDFLLNVQFNELDIHTISILDEMKGGCDRLESLINDILEASKLETSRVYLHKSLEDLSFMIRFCLRELQGLIKERNHQVSINILDHMHTMFEKERIYEVLINLLNNAIKYTPPNGKIQIKSEIKDDKYIISIEDNGIGLTEEEKSKLFKKFGKIERYGQHFDVISEGAGLGLYISKKIVKIHGGKIWVESEGRNKGSTFYLSLPITKN